MRYGNELKVKVIENNYIKKYFEIKNRTFANIKYPEYEQFDFMRYVLQIPALNCARLLANSQYKKRKKLKTRICHFLASYDCVFLTLTFTDETLENTSQETRRRYVTRFLKENSSSYVANIDFGGENGREHYHAITINRVDLNKWTYGLSYAEKIHNTRNPQALATYLTKLSAHAFKDTTKQAKIIYSKNV